MRASERVWLGNEDIVRRLWCTYRSIRQDRYDLERLRHSGSFVPRWDLMHRRYESMMLLHSPGMQGQHGRYEGETNGENGYRRQTV